MVEITGNTYPVRDQLKALGGVWNKSRKCWMVPADKADAAMQLAGPNRYESKPRPNGGRRGACATCGCRINYGMYCGKCEYR